MKIKIKALFILVFIFIMSFTISAYWLNHIKMPLPDTNSGGVVVIGTWVVENEKTIIWNPEEPPNQEIKQGTIIAYLNHDGTITLYKALHNVKPTDEDFDPTRPNTHWTKPMKYAESTSEYRYFHHYSRGEIVKFNGEHYEYVWGVRHNPNTETEKSPEHKDRWRKIPPAPEYDYWYFNLLYNKGDIVYYKGFLYSSNQDENSRHKPDEKNLMWTKLAESRSLIPNSIDLINSNENTNTESEKPENENHDELKMNEISQNETDIKETDDDVFKETMVNLNGESDDENTDINETLENIEEWNSKRLYLKGTIVFYDGCYYELIFDESINEKPKESKKWKLLHL